MIRISDIRLFFITGVLLVTSTSVSCQGFTYRGAPLDYYYKDSNERKLASAAVSGNVSVMQTLVQKKQVNVNARGTDDVTPLLFAVKNGNKKGVETLLQLGADPNAKARFENSPMTEAVESRRDTAILEILLKNGGDPSIQEKGEPILSIAITSDNPPAAYILANHGADLNALIGTGTATAASKAAQYGYYELACFLLEKGTTAQLERLAWSTYKSTVHVPEGHKEYPYREKLIAMLRERGINYEQVIADGIKEGEERAAETREYYRKLNEERKKKQEAAGSNSVN